MNHPWFKMHHVHESPKSNPVSPNAQIPITTPAQGVSHTLMQRMNQTENKSIAGQVRPDQQRTEEAKRPSVAPSANRVKAANKLLMEAVAPAARHPRK
jgi:hypothetical protein